MLVNMGPDSGRTGGSRQGRGDGPTPRARPKPHIDGAPRGSATAPTPSGSRGGASSRAGGRPSSDPRTREDRGSTRRSAPAGGGGFDRSSSGRGRPAPAAAKHGGPGSPRTREDARAGKFGGGAGNARRSSGGRTDPRADGDNRRPRPPAAGRTSGGTSFSTRGQRDSFASRGPGPTAREPGHRAGAPRRDGPRPSYVPTERAARSPQGRRNDGRRTDEGHGQVPEAGPRWGRSRDPLSRGSTRSAPFDRDDRYKDDRYKDDRYKQAQATGTQRTGAQPRMTVGQEAIKLEVTARSRERIRTVGRVRTGPGENRPSQLDLAQLDLAQLDLAPLDLAQLDLAQRDLAQRDLAQRDLAELDLDSGRAGEAAAFHPTGGGLAEAAATTVPLATAATAVPAPAITAAKARQTAAYGLHRLGAAKRCQRAGAASPAMERGL